MSVLELPGGRLFVIDFSSHDSRRIGKNNEIIMKNI
jgi:hypothetical protein